ncbi:cAMP receptor protein [mine drainage metagenome]|uniref:cAMP receptor protein n=1 Tax=mine drainage metagenome TaxID=410659 RepID=A0A1J5RPE3_9ZZZZ
MSNGWLEAFPDLERLDPEARRALAEQGRRVSIPAGSVLFRDGDLCQAFLLVLEGQVRVQKVAESGREIVLYRVEAGQSCIMTTACLLGDLPYGAEGLTESPVEAVALPGMLFHRLLAQSDPFRRFIFTAYSTRLAGLLSLIEEVAFGRIDRRLAGLLLDQAEAGTVRATHQDLAVELGSAREVISRQLKEFERRGWIALARGQLSLLNPAALENLRDV